MTVIQDTKHKKELVLRLKRIEGQLRGIQAMIVDGQECEQVIQQISASRRALDKAFFNVLACAVQQEGGSDRAALRAPQMLAKFG